MRRDDSVNISHVCYQIVIQQKSHGWIRACFLCPMMLHEIREERIIWSLPSTLDSIGDSIGDSIFEATYR